MILFCRSLFFYEFLELMCGILRLKIFLEGVIMKHISKADNNEKDNGGKAEINDGRGQVPHNFKVTDITSPAESGLDTCKAASPSDCTGVIQVPPENEYEYESYREVYDFTVPGRSTRRRSTRK